MFSRIREVVEWRRKWSRRQLVHFHLLLNLVGEYIATYIVGTSARVWLPTIIIIHVVWSIVRFQRTGPRWICYYYFAFLRRRPILLVGMSIFFLYSSTTLMRVLFSFFKIDVCRSRYIWSCHASKILDSEVRLIILQFQIILGLLIWFLSWSYSSRKHEHKLNRIIRKFGYLGGELTGVISTKLFWSIIEISLSRPL